MTSHRTVAILSPYFPPSTLAGVHRARHLAKHLPAHGWRPLVIRTHERFYTERNDADLASLVPDSVEQIRCDAMPYALTGKIGIGDVGLRSFLPFRRTIATLVAERRIDALLITGSPFYPMLLSRAAKGRNSVPVVLDFQDPWVSAAHRHAKPLSKAGAVRFLAEHLEPIALRSADFVTSVSDVQNREMAGRYPWLRQDAMAAIPIGGDPDDFASVRDGQASRWLDRDRIEFCYVGTLLPRAGPLAQVLFASLRRCLNTRPDLANRIRMTFIGTSNQPNGTSDNRIMAMARDHGVEAFVREIPQRIDFLEALRVLAQAQALVVIGSDEPHYTASKIYPTLMSGTPYLSIFHGRSSAHRILSDAAGGLTFAFEDLAQLKHLEGPIAAGLERLALEPASFRPAAAASFADYTAKAVAGKFATIFSDLAGRGLAAP